MSKAEHNYMKFFLVVFALTAVASTLAYVRDIGLDRETIWLAWRVAMQLVFLYFIARHLGMVSKMLRQIQQDRLERDTMLAELKQTAEELAKKTEQLAMARGNAIDEKLQAIDDKVTAVTNGGGDAMAVPVRVVNTPLITAAEEDRKPGR